eukprot:gene1924-biopygen14746
MISTCQFCLKTFPHCLAFERHKHLYKNGECVNDPDSLPSRNVPHVYVIPPRGTPFLDEDPVQPSDSHPDDEVASEEDTSCNQEEIDQLVWSTLSSMKISIRDQQTILDLMNDLRGYKDKTGLSCSITTIEGFNQYTSKTVSSMKSILIHPSKEGKVTVTSADVPGLGEAVFEAPYFYEDMDHFLRMEFGNEDHKGQFVLHASIKTDAEGNRCYDDPHSADLWNWFQRRIRSNVGYERSVVVALQLYSDKTHLNFKGTDCHPVLATLLNICHGKRIKSYKHVAYLPKMSQTTLDVSASVFRLVKLSAYSKIITALLATMKEKSHTGVTLTDPWGKEQNVFVRFCSYVVDNPEIADMWCTKQGQTAFPCEAFLKDKYANASVLLSKLNSRLASGVLTWASDFQLPYAGGVYVPDHSRVQAKEHRNVMQILPHILNDIDDDMTRLACLWISAYKIRHRKGCDPHITDAVLKSMDDSISEFIKFFLKTLGRFMKSGGNTVKMHKLLHVTTLIRRLGHTENFNSNFYESDHKKVKQDYQRTSKRSTTFLQEMIV